MNKLYSVHDHWTDINKKNDVDIESIDGVITGIKVNGEDYGGTSWTEVFSGNVVTSGEAVPFSGTINAVLSGSDTIKVFYNDGVYILPKQVTDDGIFYGAPAPENPSNIDFSEIPFLIRLGEVNTELYTQSPGPKDITILEPQSGGGENDFSTAEVTYRLTFNEFEEAMTNAQVLSPISVVNNELGVPASVPVEDISQGSTSVDIKCFTPLYKNKITVDVSRVNLHNEYVRYVYAGAPITATGNATITNNSLANITGDCVITIPVELRN